MSTTKQKIYGFCNLVHSSDEEHQIRNHSIIALDETGKCVGSWISSNHSFGKTDIVRGIAKNLGDEWKDAYNFEWVEDTAHHPELQKIFELQ